MREGLGSKLLVIAGTLLCSITILVGSLSAQGLTLIDDIITAHNGGPSPVSVRLTGTVERNKSIENFTLLATRDERVRLEFGTEGKDVVVVSQGLSFSDDGQKFVYPKTPSGFAQLDVTSVFLVQQLRSRAVRAERMPAQMTVNGVLANHIRVEGERTQLHPNKKIVNDRVDLYVAAETGLLLAITRNFYEGLPERYTLTYTFSDYRKTEGSFLPYRVEAYIKGKKTQTFVIESYQFDVPAARELFMSRRAK